MIKPRVKIFLADGTKKRIELYNRPPMLYLDFEEKNPEGEIETVSRVFTRSGPDDYKEIVKNATIDVGKN